MRNSRSQQFIYYANLNLIMRSRKQESQALIDQLTIRFQRKPRKCKKKNDSGIGSSQRIVCVAKDRFYYYPKIQQFNDLDFDKLQYVVPKAGIKLSDILELKFPPRRNNQRNYFTIVIPNNKILKYTKTFKQTPIDENSQGEQQWTFVFDCDIISLPELEKRLELVKHLEHEKMLKKKLKDEEDFAKKEEEMNKKMQQEYESLVQTQKLISEKQGKSGDEARKYLTEKQNEKEEKKIEQADQYHFDKAYRKLLKAGDNQMDIINAELDVLEAIGKFKKRAEVVVKKYIDELPYNSQLQQSVPFIIENLLIKFSNQKYINLEFLDTMKVAYAIYDLRKKIDQKIRVPLMVLIKYKGFKVLVRSITPCDTMSQKEREEKFVHGKFQQNWKTHFLLVDDLNIILDSMNLKPYNCQLNFQRIVLHFGTRIQLFETGKNPFEKFKAKNTEGQTNSNQLIYIFNISQVFPIDLDLEKNIKQDDVRMRPEYVENYREDGTGQKVKLVGGALTYEYQDQQGARDDLTLAKASQTLKYKHLVNFCIQLDQLKFIPMNSEHLIRIIKQNGINMRYIASIYKLTSLPYIREMITVEMIAREVKKIYRDYQRDFINEVFRQTYKQMISEAYDEKSMNSLKVIRVRQLGIKQKQKSIENAIDFLNLLFGCGVETENIWKIVEMAVKKTYKISINHYTSYSFGYLLTTILDHCNFKIKLNSSLHLFTTPAPFTIKDWIQFKCKTSHFTYPSFRVHSHCRITPETSEEVAINKLELSLYISRIFGHDESKILTSLSTKLDNSEIIEKDKFTIANLQYHISKASKQNFDTAYEICTFLMPASHPYFQDLYLKYARLNTSDSVILKKAAENHAIRTLGIMHWKTSQILVNFKEEAYLKHLVAAESGIDPDKKMDLFHKITQEQAKMGKFMDSFSYVKRAITFAEERKGKIRDQEVSEYIKLLILGIQNTYKLRKIEDSLKISEELWNVLEKYRKNANINQQLQSLLYFSLKPFLENSKKKYYIFKIVLIIDQKIREQKLTKNFDKSLSLTNLRERCRESRNHINWIKQILTKLQFAYIEMNDLPDFFSRFWNHVEKLHSEQLEQGLEELKQLVKLFGKQYFEEALLDRIYTFEKGLWDIPKQGLK